MVVILEQKFEKKVWKSLEQMRSVYDVVCAYCSLQILSPSQNEVCALSLSSTMKSFTPPFLNICLSKGFKWWLHTEQN